ncbi:MAG: type II/IV secretion system protein [Planctomycetales bacterium]|nr:type II/IV secretion system protein [Planctomycetales bacterium]
MRETLVEPDEFLKLELVDLADVSVDPVWSHALPATGVRRYRALAICEVQHEVVVVTCNHRLDVVRNFVESRIRQPYRLVRAEENAFRDLLSHVFPPPALTAKADAHSETCETVEVCDELMRAACLRGASDIHLVPEKSVLRTRFRVDGILEDYRSCSIELLNGLASRIKVLAGMNIAEKREPQDGRFNYVDPVNQKPLDVRVATIPTRFGERVTLRLLSPLHGTASFENLGMAPEQLELFTRAIKSSNGLILLTGPTGCGKSTTLYTAIQEVLRTRGGNVITVEDPVEFEIPGTSQVEVDSSDKISFSRALRSILRHDPDVIMLGEIRDAETAEFALKASLTGHLVFSTLHTNTASGVITRLIDMGVEPFLIAATLRLAVAQRLVRKLCPKCRTPARLGTAMAASLGDPELAGREAFEASGCLYCAGKKFTGRIALFEMLPGDSKVAELISSGASETEILEHMERSDHSLLLHDGIAKMLSGTTTAEQVLNAVAMW